MTFTGLTTDVAVTSTKAVRDFYRIALGRDEDLAPEAEMLEWILHAVPQVSLRVVEDASAAGGARVGIGVDDLAAERARLAGSLPDVPEVDIVPGVIALLEITDPDGNRLVFWEDLLTAYPDDPAELTR